MKHNIKLPVSFFDFGEDEIVLQRYGGEKWTYSMATMNGDNKEANAAHIVKCVNNHDALVHIAKLYLEEMADSCMVYEIERSNKINKLLTKIEAE